MSRFTPEHDAPDCDPPRPRYALWHKILLAVGAAAVSLAAMELLCRGRGQAAAPPTPLQSEQYLYSVRHDVPVIDLVAVFRQLSARHSPQEVFLDEGHATALANQEIARLLAGKLKPWLEGQTVRDDASPQAQ